MSLKLRSKQQDLQNFIIELENKEKPIWKAVAKGLNRPRRKEFDINLYRLDRVADGKETVIVPGTVLGTGDVTKKLNVAAWKFSGSARQKIEKAGGKCWEIALLVKENPEGKGIRILA